MSFGDAKPLDDAGFSRAISDLPDGVQHAVIERVFAPKRHVPRRHVTSPRVGGVALEAIEHKWHRFLWRQKFRINRKSNFFLFFPLINRNVVSTSARFSDISVLFTWKSAPHTPDMCAFHKEHRSVRYKGHFVKMWIFDSWLEPTFVFSQSFFPRTSCSMQIHLHSSVYACTRVAPLTSQSQWRVMSRLTHRRVHLNTAWSRCLVTFPHWIL